MSRSRGKADSPDDVPGALLRCGEQERAKTRSHRHLHGAEELGERGGDATVGRLVHTELIVASSKVLHKGMPDHDHPRAVLPFQAAHGAAGL